MFLLFSVVVDSPGLCGAHTPAHRLHFYRQFGAHTPAHVLFLFLSCVRVLFFGFGLPWGWRRKSRNGRACLVMVSAYPCAYPNASVGPLGRPSGLSPPAHSPRRIPQALSKALIGVQGGLVQAHRPGSHGASPLNGQGSSWQNMVPWAGSSKSWGASPTITFVR